MATSLLFLSYAKYTLASFPAEMIPSTEFNVPLSISLFNWKNVRSSKTDSMTALFFVLSNFFILLKSIFFFSKSSICESILSSNKSSSDFSSISSSIK